MNNQDAQFRLRAYRPSGQDATDPLFREALACAERDPVLRTWQAREQAWDAAFAEHVRALTPPPGLRDSILSGARLEPRVTPWRWPVILAIAASLTLLGVFSWHRFAPSADAFLLPQLASWAAADVRRGHHIGLADASVELRADLANPNFHLAATPTFDWARVKPAHCRTLRFAGRDVWEVCFSRAGGEYHLYVCALDGGPADVSASLAHFARNAVATWSDARYAFALVGGGESARVDEVL